MLSRSHQVLKQMKHIANAAVVSLKLDAHFSWAETKTLHGPVKNDFFSAKVCSKVDQIVSSTTTIFDE